MALFVWNVTPAASVSGTLSVGGLAAGLTGTSGVLYISNIIQFFDHDKSSSISQLIKSK